MSAFPNLKKASVLLVDDDADVLLALQLLLRPHVRTVATEKTPARLTTRLAGERPDLILLDMNYQGSINNGQEGLYWLGELAKLAPGAAVVLITAYADIGVAVRGMKAGAADFVVKPWQNDLLLTTLDDALVRPGQSGQNGTEKTGGKPVDAPPGPTLLGESEAMQTLRYTLGKIAPTDANVLILGENGTGKDVVARLLHAQSARANGPFVGVDVGALSESLFESELFGYVKGAFTDARQDRIGRFETAQGGTLFLDEIGNITPAQQARLLSVLQNRTVTPLGSNRAVPVDVRVVSATNAPLYGWAAEGRFRKDLIYRLNTVELTLPPLRDRGDDVVLLARHFLTQYALKYGKQTPTLAGRALARLRQYAFPGNVRELQHTMERAVILTEGGALRPEDLLFSPVEPVLTGAGDGPTRLDELERSTIQRVVDKHHGNITKAAKELGITRMALYRRLGKYDL